MSNQVRAAGGKPVFLQGEVVVNPKTGLPQFVPGTYDGETGKFVPGMVVDTIDGPMFVEGMLHRYNFVLSILHACSEFNILHTDQVFLLVSALLLNAG